MFIFNILANENDFSYHSHATDSWNLTMLHFLCYFTDTINNVM